MSESQPHKKKIKYRMDEEQRKALIYKMYPVLLLGSLIWLSAEFLFSYLFSDLEFTGINLIFYIIVVVVVVNLFVLFYFTSKNNKVILSFLIFVAICILAGILSLPIVIFTEFLPQVHMFVSLSAGANIIVVFVAFLLRDKYFAKGYIWLHILLFLIGCAIVELAFIFIFNIQNFLLTVPISLSYILIVSLILMFYGVRTAIKAGKERWTYALFKTLGILLVALALAVVVVVIVLLIIACAIATEGNIDLSGFGGGGGGKVKRKKQQTP